MAYELHVYGTDFKRKAVIANFATLQWIYRWFTIDDVQLTISFEKNYIENLIRGNFIVYKDSFDQKRTARITGRNITLDEKGEEKLLVRAKGCGIIPGYRICIPPAGQAYDTQSAAAETVMKNLVKNNITLAADVNRRINGFTVAVDLARGNAQKVQARYDNLRTTLEGVAQATGLGWQVYLDTANKQLVFEVYQGTDRSASVLLDPKRRSIKSQAYDEDDTDYKNFSYVGGQGEEIARTIGTYGTATGIDRREMFVDARDIATAGDLPARGAQKLTEYPIVQSMANEVLTSGVFQFNRDYFLGDLVKARNTRWGVEMTTRVVEVTEGLSDKGRSIKASFGSGVPRLGEIIKRDLKQTDRSVKR